MSNNIIQLSIPRTGSTLIYQVLTDLLPDFVISKSHEWRDLYKDKIIIGTYRDPRAIAVSYWRTNKNINSTDKKMSKADINRYIRVTNNTVKNFEPYINNEINHNKIIFLKYELFYNDYDYLFNMLEDFLDEKFDDNIKENIKKNRSINCNKEIAAKFSSFREFDKDTFIHGKHIHKNGDSSNWKDFVKQEDHNSLEVGLKQSLKILGYY